MDKRVIFAVAGSGKTSHIIKSIDTSRRSLIVTYTDENYIQLKQSIVERFGCIPENVTLITYFRFLYSFCFRPLLGPKFKPKGMDWQRQLPRYSQRAPKSELRHYMTPERRCYHGRLAKLVIEEGAVPELNARIEKYFDDVYVDEVQDFAANDFNLLMAMSEADVNWMLVGDYFQHTFDTSRDGNTRKNLHTDLVNYLKEFEKSGILPDTETLSNSYRCSPSVCRFVSENIGINIGSHREDETDIAFIDDEGMANTVFRDDLFVKLFYEDQAKYPCYSNNWGKSKGRDCYTDVCVVLNKTTFNLYQKGRLSELAPSTRNKLYVACTRAKGTLYFVSDAVYKKYKLT